MVGWVRPRAPRWLIMTTVLVGCSSAAPPARAPVASVSTLVPPRPLPIPANPYPQPQTTSSPLVVRTLPVVSEFTPDVVAHLRQVRARHPGRRDNVFMKVGDSSTVSRGFLRCLASDREVDLAGRIALLPTLEHFRRGNARGQTPFGRQSLAAAEGWSTRHVLTGRPPPLLAEVRAIRPRFAFVMNGGNDVQGHDEHTYARRLSRIVEMLTGVGVIPILNSLPARADNEEANEWVLRYNAVSWAIAQTSAVPYLDYHQVMAALPRRGLAGDGVHPNVLLVDGRGRACDFTERGLRYGHNVRNLWALRMLDLLRRTVVGGELEPVVSRATSPMPHGARAAEWSEPVPIRHLPFAYRADTRHPSAQSRLDRYRGCEASQNESGPEIIFHLRTNQTQRVRAAVVSLDDTDVDLHLLSGTPHGDRCVARDDRELEVELTPGDWYFSVDSFVPGRRPRSGPFLFVVVPVDAHSND